MLKSLKGKYLKQQTREKKGEFSINTTTALKVNECSASVPSGPGDAKMQITRCLRVLLSVLLRSLSSWCVASDLTWHVFFHAKHRRLGALVSLSALKNGDGPSKKKKQSTWKWSRSELQCQLMFLCRMKPPISWRENITMPGLGKSEVSHHQNKLHF